MYIFSSQASQSDLTRLLLSNKLEDFPSYVDMLESLQHFRKPDFVTAVEVYKGRTGSGKSQRALHRRLQQHPDAVYAQFLVDGSFLCQNHESELWKSKAGVLVYKDRGGLKIDLATGQN